MSGERVLPEQASLRYLKLEAKRRRAAGEFPTLHDAQFAIAREHGEPSWAALREAVGAADAAAGNEGHAATRLRWIVARFRGAAEPGWPAPGEDELREHFTAEFLAAIQPDRLIPMITEVVCPPRGELVITSQTPFTARGQLAGLLVMAEAACVFPAADGLWATAADLVRFGLGWPTLVPRSLAAQALRPHARQANGVHVGLGWAAVAADGAAVGTQVELVPEPSARAASADLRAGRIDLAIVDGRQVIDAKSATAAVTSTATELAQAVARTVGTAEALQAARLTPAQAAVITGARPLPVSSLQPGGQSMTQRNKTLVGVVLIGFMLTQYNAWTLTGVLEEKSSRIVEVLLAAVTPARLLAGKVLGIGLTVFVQVGLVVVVAACEVKATHSDALTGITPEALASTIAWLVLGYAFYSWLYAAAGSTVDRQEQAQSLLLPLALPVFFGYFMAAVTANSGSPSVFFHVLAYLPPTAPFAMPVLVSLGAVPWWQFALSAVITVACTAGVARLATAVYRASILRTGSRVPLRELLTR